MAKSKAKLPRAKAKAPRVKKVTRAPVMSIAVVEVDPASFPDDLREHAVALAPLVAKLRVIASKRPKQIRIGPPTTRDRVQALATHYQASLRPDYTALMMLYSAISEKDEPTTDQVKGRV